MKLSSPQIEKICSQTSLEVVREDGSAAAELSRHFGEHTFFVDPNGLFVVEAENEGNKAQPLLVAEWGERTGDGQRQLLRTEPRAVGPELQLALD